MTKHYIIVSDKQKKHYKSTYLKHGATAKGVDWRNEKTASIRHDQFFQLFQHDSNACVLDIGCGHGSFYSYLIKKKFKGEYTGIDIVDEMVEYANKNISQGRFFICDFLQDKIEKYDYLIANGIFTQKLDVSHREMEKFVLAFAEKMFLKCKKGIAFNLMSSCVNFHAENLFYKSPSEMIAYVMSRLSGNFILNHNYRMYEYTLYVYK